MAVDLSDLINPDDARMAKRCGCLGFALKSPDGLLGGELPQQKHLEGDDAVQFDVARPIHDAHAAMGDFLEKFVVAETPWILR